MIISYKWLLEYLPENLSVEALSKILTSIGLEVEGVEKTESVKGGLEGLLTGEVLTCEKHPNADKLKITTVNTGQGAALNIICGAPNVAAGQKVIIAPAGTTVYPTEGEPFEIKKAKIRGEESQGMICAEDEIGLGKSHEGIMVLPENTPVGIPAKDFFKIPEADYRIHIGLTPNRSDAMSHIGVARDICAYLSHHKGKDFAVILPEISLPAQNGNLDISIEIEDTDACPRYAGIAISGVKTGPSPEWLQQRLNAIEVRPVNNIVDITNFVLHEFGQPLHAFDADKIRGKKIRVGFLKENTSFLSLDEKRRSLRASDLMICDAEGGMCMAGVFGGSESGVSEDTANVFIESAYFNPAFIRRTSLHHGLRTDAATHFEKGVDIDNLIPALKRAASLMTEIAGGSVASEIKDVYPNPVQPVKINLSCHFVQKLSGKDYSKETIHKILSSLGFKIEDLSDYQLQNLGLYEEGECFEYLSVTVPTHKTDISQPADLVEEIIRIDGLDNIEIPRKLNISLLPPKPNDRLLKENLSNLLCDQGFYEIVTNSIVNSRYYPERTDLVKMLNSLSRELDVMRPSMLESGLEVIQYNCNRKNTDLLLYEFGNVYLKTEEAYQETSKLAIWVTGNVAQKSWNQKQKPADIYFLKGVLQNLLSRSGIKKIKISFEEDTVIWKYKNEDLIIARKISREKGNAFEIKQEVLFAEINWPIWTKASEASKIQYQEVPRFPSVQRDLALIIDKEISYQQIEQVTGQLNLPALSDYGLFDIFESEKLGRNKKSFALNYTFQLQDRTLTDAEIERWMKQLMDAYKTKLQAQIRES